MSELVRERCQACHHDTPTISGEEQVALLQELNQSWAVEDRSLRRQFEFPNFAAAFTLATRVALLAEREGHHPDLRIGWGYLAVELTTHAAGGLTRNDFILAAKIDRAADPTAPR
ncbi:MAG TPA: 4a-hydroxytetrahydrobiopterin dehydratase [Candidatus Micrarchaeaceae archaeon]|nr:4a-hydroxytetrahydrobiopterin dehydratase [Candidatus Micrarchaeaceae archaeon]